MATGKYFDATTTTAFLFDPSELCIIGLDTKHKAGEHPLYDERIHLPLNTALVQSIIAHGFRRTIHVRREGDQAIVVDGRQAVKAAREANKILRKQGKETIKIPVMPERGMEDGAAMGMMILSNELRHDDDTMTRATKASRYLSLGKTEEEVAIAFGVAASTVEMWLELLELHPEVQAMVKAGEIGAKAASRLGKLPREAQPAAARELVENGVATVDGAAAKVREVKAAAKSAPKVARVADADGEVDSEEGGPAAQATAYPRPSTSQLRQVRKALDKGKGRLDLQARLLLLWVLGEGPASDVEGLAEVLDVLAAKAARRKNAKGKAAQGAETPDPSDAEVDRQDTVHDAKLAEEVGDTRHQVRPGKRRMVTEVSEDMEA